MTNLAEMKCEASELALDDEDPLHLILKNRDD